MRTEALDLKGALLLALPAFTDERGDFVKSFQDSTFRELGISFELKESYFDLAKANCKSAVEMKNQLQLI